MLSSRAFQSMRSGAQHAGAWCGSRRLCAALCCRLLQVAIIAGIMFASTIGNKKQGEQQQSPSAAAGKERKAGAKGKPQLEKKGKQEQQEEADEKEEEEEQEGVMRWCRAAAARAAWPAAAH